MRRRGTVWLWLAALTATACLTAGCGQTASQAQSDVSWEDRTPTHSMKLQYAEQFSVDYYDDGSSLITIGGNDRYLVVPEGTVPPTGLDEDVTLLRQPLDNLYLAASSAMDSFRQLDELDRISMTSTTRSNWSLPEVQQALDSGTMCYAGKYSAPDYEQILTEGCRLAIESTMIYHSPEVKEQLEGLGIPVLVERSSYESHPLGRMEWIRLYGLLSGKEEAATTFFDSQVKQLDGVLAQENTGKTVAFFYISSNGYVNVHKPGDYISKMIELAGGQYVFSDLETEDNALSTTNMQMEAFYAGARDADYLIYNSAIDGELQTIDQLLEKDALLASFRAVKEGNVWCTGKNMFQQTTGVSEMILDLNRIITGQAGDETQLTYLHRLT